MNMTHCHHEACKAQFRVTKQCRVTFAPKCARETMVDICPEGYTSQYMATSRS